MISKTLQKRNSLERFIREQTLGPGINGFKFVGLLTQTRKTIFQFRN